MSMIMWWRSISRIARPHLTLARQVSCTLGTNKTHVLPIHAHLQRNSSLPAAGFTQIHTSTSGERRQPQTMTFLQVVTLTVQRVLCAKSDGSSTSDPKQGNASIVKKFKEMFKDYWYILVPVHCFTSIFWGGGFYLLCKSGVDVVAILEYCGTSHEYLEKIQNSDYAYYALAYACYKVVTPARYTITVAGTTVSIKYLSKWGYLRSTSQIASDMKSKTEKISSDMRHKRVRVEEEWEKSWKKFAEKKERFSKKD